MTAVPENPLPASRATPDEQPSLHDLSPRFVGSGREYFGIWIVNLMLLVVTLGLYYPWARARSLRFFAGNTEAGSYPFEFTGVARQMFGGFMIALVLFLVYSVAGEIDPRLGWLAFLAGVLLWPWLIRAALRFRLSRSRWRGLTMRFTGTTRQVYAALKWPLLVFGLLMVLQVVPLEATVQGAAWTHESSGFTLETLDVVQVFLIVLLVLLVPYIHYRISQYQHQHFAWGTRSTRFTAKPRGFYGLHLSTLGVMLLLIVMPLVVVAIAAALSNTVLPWWPFGNDAGPGADDTDLRPIGAVVIAVSILYLPFALQVVSAWFSRGSFNLRWSHTEADGVTFAGRLKFWRWLFLRIRNLVLILLTLGLYKPFAAVAVSRMQLGALSVMSTADPATLLANATPAGGSAASDAAADLFDLDIGL